MWTKRLAFILWLAFCVALGFLIALLSRKECILKVCVKKANLIVADMDVSYKKCDNFYKSICGKYGLREKGDLDVDSIWEEMKEKQVHRLVKFLNEPIKTDDDRVLRILKKIFRSCLDTDKIEKEGLHPLKKLIHLAGGFPLAEGERWDSNVTVRDWVLGIEEYNTRETGFSGGHMFQADVDVIGKEHFVHLSPPRHLDLDASHLNDYFDYIKTITLAVNGTPRESMDEEIKDTIKFKGELLKISIVKRNCTKTSEKENLKSIDDEFPFISIGDFLGNMSTTGRGAEEVAFVDSSDVGKEYLQKLKTLVEKTPRRIISNYMMIENIVEVTPMLPSVFRSAYNDFVKKTKGSRFKSETNRKVQCVKCIKDKMVSALSALYLKKYFVKFEQQEYLANIVLALKFQMKQLVDGVKWMDSETKKRALWKIGELDFAAPVPEDVFEEITNKKKFRVYYENLCFTGNISDSLSAFVALQQFKSDKNWELLERPIESFDNSIDIFTGEIKFDYKRNVVVIPIGFLNFPAFNNDWPNYLNYGGFCSKLAMELFRGVDFVGKDYDASGNSLKDWWTTETQSEYGPQSRCFVNKYNEYLSAYTDTRIKDPRCILDDIVAAAGVQTAFMAYEDYAHQRFFKERDLPKLKNFTPNELFFVDFATFYCHDNDTFYYRGMNELEASKSSNEYVVNGALRNFNAFSKQFGCVINDTMNPYAKCNIWGNR